MHVWVARERGQLLFRVRDARIRQTALAMWQHQLQAIHIMQGRIFIFFTLALHLLIPGLRSRHPIFPTHFHPIREDVFCQLEAEITDLLLSRGVGQRTIRMHFGL